VQRYFVPPPEYFVSGITNRSDPYGLLWSPTRAKSAEGDASAVVNPRTRSLLGTHKFTHSLLLNLDFLCPIGCSDCYKARFGTREYVESKTQEGHGKVPSPFQHSDYGEVRAPNAKDLEEHLGQVVAWLNTDRRGQDVYDVIVSGGEPLVMSDELIGKLLNAMRTVRNLRVLRICTGTLFLGLPVRFTDELLTLLQSFRDDTGARVTVQAHLACTEQLTPEAVLAVAELGKRRIPVYSQIPIKQGINFFLDDPNRTLRTLAHLGRAQVALGVEPYMFIVDMHPSTDAFYVPIEPLLMAWSGLVESHDHPGLERPRTLSVLFEGGNILLSGASLLAMRKSVDIRRGTVTYRLPRFAVRGRWNADIAEVFTYEEPLSMHNADPGSLEALRRRWERMTT